MPAATLSKPLQFSPSVRVALYVGALLSLVMMIGVGMSVNNVENPRIFYLLLMSVICFSPILWLDRLNGRYFLLMAYMLVDYQYFAFADLMSILVGAPGNPADGLLTPSEMVILASALSVLVGYKLAVRWWAPRESAPERKDWPFGVIIPVGLTFWLIGTAALMYWQTYVITDRSNVSLLKNIRELGPAVTTLFMLGQLVQPLGIMILAYAYAAFRKLALTPMILLVVGLQMVLGFVADYKSEAMLAALLVVAAKTYIDGRIPKGWLAAAALFIVFVFPVFQAYRLQVRGEQGATSADALQDFVGTVQKSIEATAKVKSGFGGAEYRVNSFWERASLKSSVDRLVNNAGSTVPFQMGATLTPVFTAFFPRILWGDKEAVPVGQLFNKTFHISAVEDTYISPSHVGEVYWNFGWAGTLVLMPLLGLLLGAIGGRCAAYPSYSLTTLMIMLVTIFTYVLRAEGSIATEVVVWMRSMAAIGLMHWAFAKPRAAGARRTGLEAGSDPVRPPLVGSAFPNLLR